MHIFKIFLVIFVLGFSTYTYSNHKEGHLPSYTREYLPIDKSVHPGRSLFHSGDGLGALALLIPLAKKGIADAQYYLGETFSSGRPKAMRSHELAFNWKLKAAKQNHFKAMADVSTLYKLGWGVEKDSLASALWAQRAVEFLRSEADNGNIWAMMYMGRWYQQGNYLVKDEEYSKKWYVKAAQALHQKAINTDGIAQKELGDMYEKGLGVAKNSKEAEKWFRVASSNGNTDAIWNIGWLYELRYIKEGAAASDNFRSYVWYYAAKILGKQDMDGYISKRGSQMDTESILKAKVLAAKCVTSLFLNCVPD